jgi:ribonuclease BN (tRNA processing enzyme)
MNFRMFVALMLALVMVGAWFAACVIYRAAEIGELVSPLEPRVYSRMTVTAVGTGSSYENPTRLGPSTAVSWGSHIVLVDAGRGIADALRGAKIPIDQPQIVLISHLMPVNTLGLDELLFTGWLRDREEPLRVLGPSGTRDMVETLMQAYQTGREALGRSLPLPADGARIVVEDIADGWSETIDGVTIRAAALPEGPLPTLAYRFEHAERSVVVATTGWGVDALVDFAKGTNILVQEGVYIPPSDTLEDAGVVGDPERLEREAAIHMPLLDVGGVASRAKAERLMLVRLQPPPFYALQVRAIVGETYDGEILVPEDGGEYEP